MVNDAPKADETPNNATTLTAQLKANEAHLFNTNSLRIAETYAAGNDVTLSPHDCLDFLETMPTGEADLIVTSPPYNIGKSYERRLDLKQYTEQQARVIEQCARVLSDHGSICWQVGNHVDKGEIFPLDAVLYPVFKDHGLKMRNRIVWHFEHGLHCQKRFSGRHEAIMWFTKSDNYYFDVDPIRIPQKYPNKKYYKGEKAGELSGNPKGKNPGDLWVIPNVKHNHVEKTSHPCQFPVELVERVVLSMSKPQGLVVDPFMGVGSAAVAAIRHARRAAGSEVITEYLDLAKTRVQLEAEGRLRTRPMTRPVYTPPSTDNGNA